MSYEYRTEIRVVRLARIRRRQWAVRFNGAQSGPWPSPDAAAAAVARHACGLSEWDQALFDAPADLLDWSPLGDSL